MQKDQIELRIYTPKGVVLNEPVKSVTLQGAEGEMTILPGHVRYIGALGTGVLKYDLLSGQSKRLVVSEGFCHFVEGVLYVLGSKVDTPESAQSVDVMAEKSRLQKDIATLNLYEEKHQTILAELKRVESLQLIQ